MHAGVTLADPARLDVRGTLTHGSDVFIDVNVVFEGDVTLGDRVRIGPGCVIRNSEIGADTEVFAHCVIDSAGIGAACNIGPFARFRPTLDAGRRGAHRQLRRSEELAAWARAPRPTTSPTSAMPQVGARVNIGAGTIIANYDGANKHRTRDRGRRAHRQQQRAGRADHGRRRRHHRRRLHRHDAVPAGKLTVARARQTTIENWQRPQKKK